MEVLKANADTPAPRKRRRSSGTSSSSSSRVVIRMLRPSDQTASTSYSSPRWLLLLLQELVEAADQA